MVMEMQLIVNSTRRPALWYAFIGHCNGLRSHQLCAFQHTQASCCVRHTASDGAHRRENHRTPRINTLPLNTTHTSQAFHSRVLLTRRKRFPVLTCRRSKMLSKCMKYASKSISTWDTLTEWSDEWLSSLRLPSCAGHEQGHRRGREGMMAGCLEGQGYLDLMI